MASNVFGIPITNQTLEAMPKHQGKEITATDRAYEALIMKNADNKDVNARKFVESLKPKYSAGAFLHVHNIPSFAGSIGATIYRGQDENGDASDWMLAWYNPWDRVLDHNRVCTEIRVADHYKGIEWSSIYDYKLSKFDQYSNDTWNGCCSSVIIGYSDVIDVNTSNRNCPIFEGIMTLKNAWIQ
ncbi:23 kDa jasmonate-induced protein [Ziziphus jujuba]|uniref:23 kDa jasmonate-induced protein n=1 Tax=Ziziphus jujuba TaxID=326968 RepID=A0A6P3YRS4_ZIZJJ|nr:23 kDa jasmonate-induced protein [Ziziphus jujuba]